MKRPLLALAGLAVALSFAVPAWAVDLTVSEAWSRASAGKARAGAGFMQISNSGAADDRLVAAASAVSDVTELHTHILEGTVMRMRQVEAIDVPAGQTVTLQPGGLHVMFMALKEPLAEGQTFDVMLTFEKAGAVTVPVTVRGVAAMGAHTRGH
ncbi:MAG: copper chaperone PCu(A)C [Rhodospirillaceae bacterium]